MDMADPEWQDREGVGEREIDREREREVWSMVERGREICLGILFVEFIQLIYRRLFHPLCKCCFRR